MTRRQLPTARTDRAEPCAKCPYRKDAPLAHWHAEHFTELLAKSGDPMCPGYLCHNADGNLCAGWMLDQLRRDLPSMPLRVFLRNREGGDGILDRLSDGGHDLFGSVEEMCLANLEAILEGAADEDDDETDG